MSDEINITSIINRIIQNKRAMIGIILGSFILSVVIALTQPETYKATAYLIPPENKYTQPLNVFLNDGYRLSREELTPTVVYRTFVLNIQSRKYQRKFFFDNKIYTYFEEDNLIIDPTKKFLPKSNIIKTNSDHRIAMAFAIMGTKMEKSLAIKDSEFIKTSFPNFINLFNSLGGNLTE